MKISNKIICLILISLLLSGCANVDKKLLKASELVNSGDYEKGIKIYESLIEKDESNFNAYIGLADAYGKLDEKKAEESILKKGMAYCENNQEIYERLIDVYIENGEKDKFLDLYSKYKEKVYSEKAILNASRAYKYEGNRELAFKELENINMEKVQDVEVLEELAEFYFDDNNIVELEKIVNKGIEINKKGTKLFTYKYFLDNSNHIIQTIHSADLNNDGIVENIFVITDEDNSYDSTYTKLVVQNGKTGEIIDEKDMENFYSFFYIQTGNLFNDNNLDILVNAHPGGNGVPSSPFLYGFNNNKLKEIDFELKDDIEYNYLDNFKIEIASKQFDRLYNFEIEEDYRSEYIEWGQYGSSGKVLSEQSGYGLEQIDIFHNEGTKRDGLIYSIPYYGNYMSKDYIGEITVNYNFDGSWKANNMDILDNDGPLEYKKYAEKSKEPEIPSKDDTLEETKRILNMSRSQIYENFGEPKSIDSYQTEYFDYGDKYIFISDNKASAVWWVETVNIFGIKGQLTNEKVREAFGKPLWEERNEAGLGEYMLFYKIGNLDIYFSDIDEDYGGFVNIIKR